MLMPFFLPEFPTTSEEICAKLRGDPLARDQETANISLHVLQKMPQEAGKTHKLLLNLNLKPQEAQNYVKQNFQCNSYS